MANGLKRVSARRIMQPIDSYEILRRCGGDGASVRKIVQSRDRHGGLYHCERVVYVS